MVFALPENSVIKMKFCGRQARGQKLMPPRHKATDPYRPPLGLMHHVYPKAQNNIPRLFGNVT
jgi:hypothetical protein